MNEDTTTGDYCKGAEGVACPGRCAVAGLQVGIVGSVVVALAECAAAASVSLKHWEGEAWPIGLLAAAVGRAAVTHALVWCPVLAVCGAARWVCVRGRSDRGPGPLLWALFVVLAGVVVVPTDLELAGRTGGAVVAAACGGVLGLAVAVYAALRFVGGRLSAGRHRRIGRVTVGLCVAVLLAFGVVFVRSPLFAPAGYRVPRATAAAVTNPRPNVLLVVLDTVRPDRMSCYGYGKRTTPFLEEWSAGSIVFERAVANGIWTVASHASMFTGRSVRAHGAGRANLWLDERFATVAEVLGSNGYAAASFSNNPFVTRETDLTRGFEFSRVTHHARRLCRFSLAYLCEKLGITPPVPWLDADYGAALTNQMIGQWLDGRSGEAPFLMFVNYMEAHLPYRVPKRYRRMYLDDEQVARSYELRRRAHGCIGSGLQNRFNIEGRNFLPPADREILKRQYEAAVRYVDDRVGELMGMFEQRGLLDNTLVIITSDHGEYLDTHGMWAHAFLTYEDVAHVPLLVREPGRTEGKRVTTPVQLSDIYPTILRATAGANEPGGGPDARDLIALADTGGAARLAVTEYEGPDPTLIPRMSAVGDAEVDHRMAPQTAVQDGRFQYIVSDDGRRELYDLAADPGELHNLIESHPADADRLATRLREWLEAVPRYEPTRPGATPAMSPEAIEELRSLGYVGD